MERFLDLGGWLMILALVLMLLEALITRMGWRMPEFAWSGWRKAMPKKAAKVSAAVSKHRETLEVTKPKESEAPPEAKAKEIPAADEAQRRSRFARAKK